MTALKNALICTVLASAGKKCAKWIFSFHLHYIYILFLLGQQRSRMLATLFKDERCQSLLEFPILEKMYLDRIIRPNEISQLDAMLQPHQKATTVDGYSY